MDTGTLVLVISISIDLLELFLANFVKAGINSWTRDVNSSIIFMVKKQRRFVLAVKQSTKITTQNIPLVKVYEIHRNHFEHFLMEFSLYSCEFF